MERLKGKKHKILKEYLQYYIETTGNSVDYYILNVQKAKKKKEDLSYAEWLAQEISRVLEDYGVGLKNCLGYREYFSDKLLSKGVRYPEGVWVEEIQEVIQRNYTGKLVLDLDGDRVWVETLRAKGYEVVAMSEENSVDFYNEYDFGAWDNSFYTKLPARLREAIQQGEEMLISFNGYTRQGEDMLNTKEEMRLYGLGKYKTPEIMALFRVIQFKQEYGLRNCKIAFFGELDLFTQTRNKEIYAYLKSNLGFERGVCFEGKVLGLRGKRQIGYSVWGQVNDIPIIFREKVQYSRDKVIKGIKKLQRMEAEGIDRWFLRGYPKGEEQEVAIYTKGVATGEYIKRAANVLCYTHISNKLVRNQKNIKLTNKPTKETFPIYEETFLQNVATHIARMLVNKKYKDTVIEIKKPDTEVWGYKKWLAEAVILFIYAKTTDTQSYTFRGRIDNRLFPIAYEEVERMAVDRMVIEDIAGGKEGNRYIMGMLKEVEKTIGVEAMALHNHCKRLLRRSLTEGIRELDGYLYGTDKWDCPVQNVLQLDRYKTEKEQYDEMHDTLLDHMTRGLSKYGFVEE